ncbi:MAG: DUF1573 domain-containing protein [Cyclobacteriaceae bacterium]|nr:DUF1573 domain-containing protein [Cyclobacteriaceae bacterium]
MKNILLLFLFRLLLPVEMVHAQAQANVPDISFETDSHEFGDIFQGDKVQHTFSFTNNGNAPLVLNGVLTTCGCTAPVWTKEPVLPGEEGKITIVFNSAGRVGWQNKIITVRSNAESGDVRLKISAMVLPSKKKGS